MKNNRQNRIFVTLLAMVFVALMLASPALRLLKRGGFIEYEDRANYVVPKETDGAFAPYLNFIYKLQAEVDDAYTNYLPLYITLVDSSIYAMNILNAPMNDMLGAISRKSAMTGIETLVRPKTPGAEPVETSGAVEINEGGLLPDTAEAKFFKNDGKYTFFICSVENTDGEREYFLDKIINTTGKTAEESSVKQANKLNELAAVDPNVNFNVYICTRITETSLRDQMLAGQPGGSRKYMDMYIDALDDELINVDYLKVDTVEERFAKLYRTDHHWNADGLFEAYGEIIELMGQSFTDITPARKPVDYVKMDNFEYYGTYARDMPYYKYFDHFDYYDFALPEHTQVGGKPFEAAKREFSSDSFSPQRSTDFYTTFYQTASKYTYPENHTGHNLLVIGDSFAVSVNELLASHFDNTFCMDIRYISNFNFGDYLKENNITDVLILQNTYQLVYTESYHLWAKIS